MYLLGTPETSLRGLRTLNVLSVLRLIVSSDPAGKIIGKNLRKKIKKVVKLSRNERYSVSMLAAVEVSASD